ncbi:MAG: type III-B CRISPR module-associated protein Cmr5 [Fimbriimonadales bacterium]|nr:type III-B CRISPR module-associated protein Cmr5 [Fimbriimonadales bacterium]
MNRAQRCYNIALQHAHKSSNVAQLLIAANNARNLLLSSGLCTTLAFLGSHQGGSSAQDKAYTEVLSALAEFAEQAPKDFVIKAASAPTAEYLRLSELAREALIFLARAAEMRKHAENAGSAEQERP